MTNLKINGVPTRYWCVVVEKDYVINAGDRLLFFTQDIELLGCITLSSMDEGVRELARKNEVFELYMDYMNEVFDAFRFRKPHESALSLLQHNKITLTADTKAVVVKQKI